VAMIRVKSLDNSHRQQWDRFVNATPEATFFHLSGWQRVIEEACGHRTYFLYAEDNGVLLGVLPLAQIKSLLFGNRLTSLPFCVYGGIVAASECAGQALRQAACELAEQLGVDCLEFRNSHATHSDWPTKNLYVTFRKTLLADHDKNLKAIPNRQRAVIRKGLAANLQTEQEPGWQRGYRLYAESLRNLGTPVLTARFFQMLREEFGRACRTQVITHQGRDVAALISFYFRDQVLPYYAGSNFKARVLHAHAYMYWALMCSAVEEGVQCFDYGRSKVDTGSYRFKKNWGFMPEPLHYEFFLVKSKTIPEVNPLNPKYRFFIQAWKNLPLPIANLIGPLLARNLG